MALIKSYKGIHPTLHHKVYLAETAVVVGDVEIGTDSNIWYGAVIRGDVEPIKIGKGTNIQDGAMLHTSTDRVPCIVGDYVTVGHHAILHGCTIHDEVLIGMGAVVLDEAVVPSHTLIAANAVVTEGSKLEGGFIYAGVPARKIKALSPEQIADFRANAEHYIEHAKEHGF
ncbi:MAG: gamma carbonic anhydrase family protein [Bacteroidia bacterium]